MHPELLLLIGISFSMGFTPGPNNAVASYSAFNFGVRKTLPIILGVGLGYTVLVVLLIFALISVFQKYPYLQEIIRILGSIFLIYLAYKISFSKTSSDTEKKNPVKFIETFFFQFINPKSVIVSFIMFSTYVDRGNDFLFYSFWVIGIAFLFAIISINFWTLVGKFLRRFATNEKFIKRFNYVMSLLLLACIATFYL